MNSPPLSAQYLIRRASIKTVLCPPRLQFALSLQPVEPPLRHAVIASQIGSLEISPGDLLHGDANGIVRIPRDLAARVPSTAAALRRKDETIIDYCHSSQFTVEGLRDLLAGQ